MTPTDPTRCSLVRPATRADLEAMVEVHVAARSAAPMPPAGRDVVRAQLTSGWDDDELWVVEADAVAAYVRFVRPDAQRVGWLDDLYVLPSVSGQGFGTALLDVVKASLPGGFGLWAFVANRPARRFYAARGLVEVEQVPAHESPTGEAEVRLAWPGFVDE